MFTLRKGDKSHTHARMHARTHARTHTFGVVYVCSVKVGNRIEPLAGLVFPSRPRFYLKLLMS